MESNNSLKQDGTNNEGVPDTANTSQSATSSNSWLDKSKRDAKKRELSAEKPWNKIKILKKGEVKEDETKDKSLCSETPSLHPNQQTTHTPTTSSSFHSMSFGNSENYNTDSNRPRPSFPIMPPFNMFPPMNHQWPMNPMDGINIPQSNAVSTSASSGLPIPGGMEMASNPNPTMNPYTFLGMPNDPMYGMMGGMSNFCPYPMMNGQESMVMAPVKEVITLSKCVLYPPPPTLDITPKRERPPGCKTVFVGGLPEKITEEIVREMFERYGEIVTIRMSKKNFCHIRFSAECYVDQAFFLSGYRIKIENKDDSSHFGRLHVDYAQARDDQYEYECQQRALQREARHRERMEQEALRPPTPPPVVHYSDHEASILGEKLRNEDTFKSAVHTLITWLDRGECSKRNAGFFYSMIQSTNSHVRRLMIEKGKSEEVLNKAKLMLQQKMAGIALQFNEIDKVFDASSLQKVWDHFTKAQRKNIELWKKQTSEIKKAHSEELVGDRVEDEMDVSDDEEPTPNPDNSGTNNIFREDLMKLREENDLLHNQVRAYQEEIIAVQKEKMDELDTLKSTYHTTELKCLDLQTQLEECRKLLKKVPVENNAKSQNYESFMDRSHTNSFSPCNKCRSLPGIVSVTESEVRLVALVSTFLNVHPFGASIDYICSYLVKIDPNINARDVESLMKQFPIVFKEESTGIGATLEKKWMLLAFKV